MNNIKTLAFAAAALLGCSDYERDNPNDYVNKIWTTFSDADENGGSSIIKVTDKDGSITVFGELVMPDESVDPVFAGWGTRNEGTIAKLKEATYISFGVKGGDETHRYKIQLIQSDINDYNYYYATFITAKNMRTVTLCIDNFRQADWGVAKSFDMSKVVGIEFLAQTNYEKGADNVPFGIIINSLEFGTGSCTPTTEIPQIPDPIITDDWKYIAKSNYNAGAVGLRVSTIEITNNSGAYTIAGNMGDDDVGFQAIPTESELLRNAKSVSFKVKGECKKCLFQMSAPELLYGKIFPVSSVEQTINICFNDMAVWWGDKTKHPMDMSNINLHMGWDLDGTIKEAFNFTLRDISVGNDECATTTGNTQSSSGNSSSSSSSVGSASSNNSSSSSSYSSSSSSIAVITGLACYGYNLWPSSFPPNEPITQPSFTVACDGSAISEDSYNLVSTGLDWNNPALGTYDIKAAAYCNGYQEVDCNSKITIAYSSSSSRAAGITSSSSGI